MKNKSLMKAHTLLSDKKWKDEEVTAFYEKMYFHELECREKLIPRLQLALAVLAGLIGLLAFIFSHLDFSTAPSPFTFGLFLISFVVAAVLVATASLKFINALWGHTYECLPVATEIEKYRVSLLDTYKNYDDGVETAFNYYQKFLIKYFSECAAGNAVKNEERYSLLHDSMSYIVYSAPFIVVSALTFVLGGMTKIVAT